MGNQEFIQIKQNGTFTDDLSSMKSSINGDLLMYVCGEGSQLMNVETRGVE